MNPITINARIAVGKITATASGTSSKVRCTLANHGLATGNKIFIEGVQGTTEANGYRTITVIDANTFDLDSTTYTNAFTGEGTAYKIDIVTAVITTASVTNANVQVRINTRSFGSALVQNTVGHVKKLTTTNTAVEFFRSDPTYAYLLDFVRIFNGDVSNRVVQVNIEHFDFVEQYTNIQVNAGETISAYTNGNSITSSDGRTASGAIGSP